MAILIFDFDHTIINGYSYKLIVEKKLEEQPNSQWELIQKIPPVGGSADKWRELFQGIWADGHQIAIASFNPFGDHIIPLYLKNIIGLNDVEISNIIIKSALPANPQEADKNEYISEILTQYQEKGIRVHRSRVILIDDSENNVLAARAQRYSAIHASQDGGHLTLAKMCSEKSRKDYKPKTLGWGSRFSNVGNAFSTTAYYFGPVFYEEERQEQEKEKMQELGIGSFGLNIPSDDEEDQVKVPVSTPGFNFSSSQ
ncbi:MAG: hypothetical protein KIT56_10760 [Gammaproteobacteria bacterium]|nr:hypothetical protein [Gammaproteobacteria bacterium]MCW5584325.1 hypothetical protein [Gammaproteobacteria bacterium]